VQLRFEPKQRLYDWIKTVITILIVGPPIGGFVFGFLLSVMTVANGPDKWEFVPAAVIVSMVMSYVLGLPSAAVGVALFLMLIPFVRRGTAYLAVLCGVTSTVLLITSAEMMRPSVPVALQLTWTDVVAHLVSFGIPSGISAWLCWRMTKPWHRLS
jgi:hypothetical protein